MNNKKIELKPQFDHAKSFYKKAYYTESKFVSKQIAVKKEQDYIKIVLYSYNTQVLIIWINNIDYKKSFYVCNEYTAYSMTTLRHVKEAIQQFLYNTNVLNILYKKGLTKNNIIKYTRYNEEI